MRQSVFTKVVTIMVVMAVSLMLLVVGFFGLIVSPNLNRSVDGVLEEYARVTAARAPTLATAREIYSRLHIDIRYEGPDGSWTTWDRLPSVDEIRKRGTNASNAFLPRREYRLVAAPNGGTYLFAWSLGSHMVEAHAALLFMFFALMVVVIVVANLVLRRLLQPLKALNAAVTQLGAGQLDVQLPASTRDEFGRLTEAFNQMVERVRGMIRTRDQLLIDVSHELRSPVTRMKVALELLPDAGQRARLAGDVGEMERMITELLELERLRTGKGVVKVRQDLVAIVRDVAARMEGRPPGVRVIADTPALIDIDGDKVRMAVRNLLENAIKYSLADSKPVELMITGSAEAVIVRVVDDGAGIPEGETDRLFEPFFRADPSRSKETGGYGLGLSICKRVMEAHGGTIAVERRTPRGTSFVLSFPTR